MSKARGVRVVDGSMSRSKSGSLGLSLVGPKDVSLTIPRAVRAKRFKRQSWRNCDLVIAKMKSESARSSQRGGRRRMGEAGRKQGRERR